VLFLSKNISRWKNTFPVEQFTARIRYVYGDKIRKNFIKFEPATDVTGESLAETLLQYPESCGLKMKSTRRKVMTALWQA
jgi:hypothetical protein